MATNKTLGKTTEEIAETFGMVPPPLGTIPDDDTVTEWPYFRNYTVEGSEIPAKYRELIGLAIAANSTCPYGTYFHRTAAELQDATDVELREVYSLGSFTTRYNSMSHAQKYDLGEFESKVDQLADDLDAQIAADD